MQADILICGGGTAGVVAAITAARAGADVLVVEQMGALGGTQTQSWVTPMMPNKILTENLTHGLNDEILSRAAQIDPPPTEKTGDRLWFNPVTLAFVLDDLLSEAGAGVLFHTMISDALVENGRLVGIVVENKSGRQEIRAQVTIDATGDADVAYKAGVPCVSGEPETGRRQPLSLRFALAGVDLERGCQFMTDKLGMDCWSRPPLWEMWAGECRNSPLAPLVEAATADGVLDTDDLGYLQFFAMLGRPGELAFNCPRLTGFDPTNAADLSRAQTVGRQKIRRIFRFFKNYVRGFENAYIGTVAPMVGVRDSRRIVGEYVLTEADFFAEARFPDAVARNSYPIDIHDPSSPTGTVLKKLPPGHYHEIPYRCLLPIGVENLLVAGRCLSATFAAQAAVRIQQNCRALGEAAGVAAAMCIKQNVTPREINTDELRRRLNANGAQI